MSPLTGWSGDTRGPRRTGGADGTNVGQSSRCSRLSYPGVHFKDVHQPHQRARVLKDIHIKCRASVNIFWYRWESWLYTYFHCRLKKIIWTYLDFVSTFVSVPIYIYISTIYIYNIHVYIYIYVDIHRIIYIHNCIHTQLYTHANHILFLVFSFLKLSSHVIPKDGMIIPKLARTLARTQVPTAVSERLELRGVAWAGGLTNDCSNVIYN